MINTKKITLSISNAVYYELIGRYDIARLNHILNVEIPAATGTKENYLPAKNAVKLYRITYPSVIPEQNNMDSLKKKMSIWLLAANNKLA
jgi:hypothetical protein